jgi:hypothetical protein
MNETKTESILQRVPAILAVTAASYGLPPNGEKSRPAHPARGHAQAQGSAHGRRHARSAERG